MIHVEVRGRARVMLSYGEMAREPSDVGELIRTVYQQPWVLQMGSRCSDLMLVDTNMKLTWPDASESPSVLRRPECHLGPQVPGETDAHHQHDVKGRRAEGYSDSPAYQACINPDTESRDRESLLTMSPTMTNSRTHNRFVRRAACPTAV